MSGLAQVLVFIESVIVKKKKGGICELMMVSMDSRKISAFEYFWNLGVMYRTVKSVWLLVPICNHNVSWWIPYVQVWFHVAWPNMIRSSAGCHRHITEVTGESSSRNYVFWLFCLFIKLLIYFYFIWILFFFNFIIFLIFFEFFWILEFLRRQTKGVRLHPYMGNGCVYGLIWGRHNATGFWVD